MVDFELRGPEAAGDLARLWVRASARRRGEPIPTAAHETRVQATIRRLNQPGAVAVIAVESDVAIAGCFIEQLVDPDGEPVADWAHLSGVAVEPSRWGEGLATGVLRRALHVARQRGCLVVQLHVLEVNERARRLYEHLGWVLTAVGHPHAEGSQAVYEMVLA